MKKWKPKKKDENEKWKLEEKWGLKAKGKTRSGEQLRMNDTQETLFTNKLSKNDMKRGHTN